MGTRIDIQVGQALLGQRVRDLAALNREQRIEREQRVREASTTQEALDARVANAAQRGQAQNGQLRNSVIGDSLRPGQYQERLRAQGKKSDVPEYYTAPKVAVTPQGGLEFAVGWLVKQSENVTQVVSGDGRVGLPFETETQSIIDAAGAPSPFDTSFSIAGHTPWEETYLPGDVEAWGRSIIMTGATIAMAPLTATYGADGQVLMPIRSNMLVTIRKAVDYTLQHYELTVAATIPPIIEEGSAPRDVQIYALQTVRGNWADAEDPSALLMDPSREKRLLIITLVQPTISDTARIDVFYDNTQTFNVSRGSVRRLSTPEALQSFMLNAYGTWPAASDATVPPSAGFQPIALASNTIEGISYTFAACQSLAGFPSYVRRNQSLAYTRDEELKSLIDDTPAPCFGLGPMAPDQAEMGYGSTGLSNPLVYRILDGSSTIAESDFYDTLETIEGCLTGLAPLPRQLSWIDSRPSQSTASDAYLGAGQDVTFNVYASAADNARAGGNWYGFGGDGLPSKRGRPPNLKLAIAPQSARIQPGEDFVSDVGILLATPYGDKPYCRAKLLELGFTAADLNP